MRHNLTLLMMIAAVLLAGCGKKAKPTGLTEKEATEFLYQYMPLGDSVDYTEEYFQECVHYAFLARQEMPWGKSIPEREFKHFVVPPRVNNENLDRFRATYYNELKERVKDLSLADAALEVNHWCHEHVNYKGSDSRTSAPMATVKTSWGRCGEESTLLVTALRTVGIPARQVYTPRWAHCDDNHAWVEAYVDGGWHFMGACEPEPVLDLGWFNEPASRALLLHTRVFGDYQGPEEVISKNKNYTEINVISNYAKTAINTIHVVDADNKPVPDIDVEFKIYNYAEYCTVVTKKTDINGQTQLTTGLGSMMAYACKDGRFGFEVFNAAEDNEVTIVLNHEEGMAEQLVYDITAPAPDAKMPEVTAAAREENDRRIAQEDALRNAYIAQCKDAQEQLNANTGNKSLGALYKKTWGNYQTIADFAKYAEGKGDLNKAVIILKTLSDKDLRDVNLEVLIDHYDYWTDPSPYICGPRVSNEMLVPYRKPFSNFFDDAQAKSFLEQPERLVDWVRDNIEINDELNPQRIPIAPTGVLKAHVADRHSRDIFFVAMARSLGIAAQINPVNGNVQYLVGDNESQWKNAVFEDSSSANTGIGYLDIHYQPTEALPDPKYYSIFSIKKFDGQHFHLLSYDAQDPGIDDGMNLSSFGHTPLEPGYYILTGGTRLSSGNVLAFSQFFTIKEGATTPIELILREPKNETNVIGKMEEHLHFTDVTGEEREIAGPKGYLLAFLDQGHEPTTHAMQDIVTFANQFNQTGIPLFFLFENKQEYDKFQLKSFTPLPETVTMGYSDAKMKEKIINNLSIKGNSLPIFVIVNANNDAVFASEGYTIGLASQLLKTFVDL